MKAILILGVCLVGFLIGWNLKSPATQKPTPAPSSSKSIRTIHKSQKTFSVYSKAPENVRKRLLEIAALPSSHERYRAAYAMVNALSEEELKIWINDNYSTMEGDLGPFIFNALAERLLTLSPQWLAELSFNKGYSYPTRRSFLRSWATRDPQSALAYLTKSPYWTNEVFALSEALETIARNQPNLVLSQLDHLLTKTRIEDHDLSDTFRILAESDSQLLLQSLENWPHDFRAKALEALAAQELAQDFQTGIAWAQEHAAGSSSLFWQLFRDHPETAGEYLKHYQELPPSWKGSIQFSNAIRSLAKSDLPQALGFLSSNKTISTGNRTRIYSHLFKEHGSQVIATLLKDSTIDEASRNSILNQRYLQLAGSKPEESEAFLKAISTEESRAEAIAAREQAERDLHAPPLWTLSTEEILLKATPTQLDQKLASHLKNLPVHELNQFVASYQALDQERKEEISSFIEGKRYHLPFKLLATWVEEARDTSSRNQTQRAQNLASRWASHSPLEAAAWFQSLPAERQSIELAQTIHRQWRKLNTAEADAWAQKNLPQPETDD